MKVVFSSVVYIMSIDYLIYWTGAMDLYEYMQRWLSSRDPEHTFPARDSKLWSPNRAEALLDSNSIKLNRRLFGVDSIELEPSRTSVRLDST
jgi:hypothetical protein